MALFLNGGSNMSDGMAKIPDSYEGAKLSLKGLMSISTSGLSKLRDNPAVELPRRICATENLGTERPSTAPMDPPRADNLEPIRIIQQIARPGEQMLKK